MADSIEQIKSKLDVVDVISGYIKVQKSGVNFKARCPFHNEKTPSFYISPERQIWHCFGCAKGGDMFGFIKEIESVEFGEALRILAQRAGVQLDRYTPESKSEKTELYEITEAASQFFEKQLTHSQTGQKAREYLKSRGVDEEMVREFRLGFAPDDWQVLGKFLNDRGHKNPKIVAAGLAVPKDNRQYDRFRSRITFPILDINGQVVGFTGRVFSTKPMTKEEEGAKYINTPQTLIYDKSKVLYGLHRAKVDIKTADACVLVEGNMDALMSYQAGVRNVVATSGTALTPHHLRLLQRYTTNLNFCFDTDQAGAIATRRGIGLALSQSFNIKVLTITDAECKDPADYVKKYGSGWQEVVSKAKPVIEFYFDKARQSFDPSSVESKKAIIAAIAPFIQRLQSRVERSHWVNHVASYLRVREEDVSADIAQIKDDLGVYEETTKPQATVAKSMPTVTMDMLSEALLSVIMKNPALFQEDVKRINTQFLDPSIASIVRQLTAQKQFDIDSFMKNFREQNSTYRLEFAYLKSQELWKDFPDEALKAEFYTLLHRIKQKAVLAKLATLELEMKEAEIRHDDAKAHALATEFMELTRQLAEIQKV
ncbi:MAG: DNA primase [Patescibacteria group bacterium]